MRLVGRELDQRRRLAIRDLEARLVTGGQPGPPWAALRNRQELESLTRAHFLGSWVGSASFATHVCFYPNMVARTGLSVMNAAFSIINRIRWLAELGRTDA